MNEQMEMDSKVEGQVDAVFSMAKYVIVAVILLKFIVLAALIAAGYAIFDHFGLLMVGFLL